MASTRLSDAHRQELVARYQQGETAQALAAAFGCSAATATRVVKAAIGAERYEQIKLERGKGPAMLKAAIAPTLDDTGIPAGPLFEQAEVQAEGPAAETAASGEAADDDADQAGATAGDSDAGDFLPEASGTVEIGSEPLAPFGSGFAPASLGDPAGQDPAADGDDDDDAQVLAIDDADDFGDDADDNDADSDSEDADDEPDLFTPVPVGETLLDRPAATCLPFEAAPLPDSLYMLVDKTVELQDRPLSDFPELGLLPEEESRRRALVVFSNPRQAKRHCGRTQRVIQVPDSQVIRRTAPYLLRKGITRVVLEGALYSLPGS